MTMRDVREFTCDRCGKKLYVVKRDAFFLDTEPVKDWKIVPLIGDLCPECWNKYKMISEEFKGSGIHAD